MRSRIRRLVLREFVFFCSSCIVSLKIVLFLWSSHCKFLMSRIYRFKNFNFCLTESNLSRTAVWSKIAMTSPDLIGSPILTLIEVMVPGSLAVTCKTPSSDQITAGPDTFIGTSIRTLQAMAMIINKIKNAKNRNDLNLINQDA